MKIVVIRGNDVYVRPSGSGLYPVTDFVQYNDTGTQNTAGDSGRNAGAFLGDRRNANEKWAHQRKWDEIGPRDVSIERRRNAA